MKQFSILYTCTHWQSHNQTNIHKHRHHFLGSKQWLCFSRYLKSREWLWFLIFFNTHLFILREKEKDWERERERGSQAGSAFSAQSWMQGSISSTLEIMTWAEIKSQLLIWLSHPGAPKWKYFYDFLEKKNVPYSACSFSRCFLLSPMFSRQSK